MKEDQRPRCPYAYPSQACDCEAMSEIARSKDIDQKRSAFIRLRNKHISWPEDKREAMEEYFNSDFLLDAHEECEAITKAALWKCNKISLAKKLYWAIKDP
jgi:hypothetical protein